jgi:sugar phosphate isomerase/epimerase
MRIRYSHTYWGSEYLSPEEFVRKIAEAGYEGMELFLQPGNELCSRFLQALEKIRKEIPDFRLILLQLEFPRNIGIDAYLNSVRKNFESLAALQPDFINSHTGADYFSFENNCRAIELLSELSEKTAVAVYHETHRGRFSFHAPTLIPYLEKFPQMQLVGDLSHFCAVSESMLAGQEELLQQIFPRIAHVHARIGFEHGPQVNDPAAPEWDEHKKRFLSWWKEIALVRKEQNQPMLSFTTEFGPAPYLPESPYSRQPLSNQWENNLHMLSVLKASFGNEL